jgi:hypothetical protein
VKLGFTVKAAQQLGGAGSVTSLNKRARGSLTSLNKAAGGLGGSLLSLGGREGRNMAAVARSVGRRVERAGERARQAVAEARAGPAREEAGRLGRLEEDGGGWGLQGNRDPGVCSDEEEEEGGGGRDDLFQFDRLSHRSSLRSEASLGRLGTVSPAVSTPDLEAMRRPVLLDGERKEERLEEEEENEVMVDEREEREEVQEEEDDEALSLGSRDSDQTLAGDYSLPSYSQAMSGRRRIIPVVGSEPESSPSPEGRPSSPRPASPGPQGAFTLSARWVAFSLLFLFTFLFSFFLVLSLSFSFLFLFSFSFSLWNHVLWNHVLWNHVLWNYVLWNHVL